MRLSRTVRSLVRSSFAFVVALALTASATSASCPLVSALRLVNQTAGSHSVRVTDTEGCGFDVTLSLPPGGDMTIPVVQGGMLPIIDGARSMPISVAAGQTVTLVID